MSYYIYKLEVGDYFYWGSSKDKYRLLRHKTICYNPKQKGFNTKLSNKVRQLIPNPKHFYDMIHCERYYENLDISTKKYMENILLQKYKDNPYSLNTETRIYQQGETTNQYFNEKIKCDKCDEIMCRGSIPRHIKRKHSI